MPVQFQPKSTSQTIPVEKQQVIPAGESSGRLASRLVLRGVAHTAEFIGAAAGVTAGVAGTLLMFNAFAFLGDIDHPYRDPYRDACGMGHPFFSFWQTHIKVVEGAQTVSCVSPAGIPWTKDMIRSATHNQYLVGGLLMMSAPIILASCNKIATIARDWEHQIAHHNCKGFHKTS